MNKLEKLVQATYDTGYYSANSQYDTATFRQRKAEREALRAEVAELLAQRADLLAALERLVDGIMEYGNNNVWRPLFWTGEPLTEDERFALEKAVAAIARARGEDDHDQ